MLNDTLFHLSLNGLKDFVLQDLTIFNIALGYILLYVIYKALGRYIYFKPQEHASKVNRTFLLLSLLVFILSSLKILSDIIPTLAENQWLYLSCILIVLIAPFSILFDKIIWRYDEFGYGYIRNDDYLPVKRDYYKTASSRSSRDGNTIHSWEEESVVSTGKNIHSDALMNLMAGVVFLATVTQWSYENFVVFGWYSAVFSIILFASITLVYIDRSVFSWIKYLSEKKKLYALDLKIIKIFRRKKS